MITFAWRMILGAGYDLNCLDWDYHIPHLCMYFMTQSVLDAQRAQNLNIMLAKFGKRSYLDIAQVVNVTVCCIQYS